MRIKVKENRISEGSDFIQSLSFVHQKVLPIFLKNMFNTTRWKIGSKSGYVLEEVFITDPKFIYGLYPDNLIFQKLFEHEGDTWLGLVRPNGELYNDYYFFIPTHILPIYCEETTCLPKKVFYGDWTGTSESEFLKLIIESEENLAEDVVEIENEEEAERYIEYFRAELQRKIENRFSDGKPMERMYNKRAISPDSLEAPRLISSAPCPNSENSKKPFFLRSLFSFLKAS